MLHYLFGRTINIKVYLKSHNKQSGFLQLEKANVKWFLSIDYNDLPEVSKKQNQSTHRSIVINGDEMEFSEGFNNLHIKSYEEILQGNGFDIKDNIETIETISKIRDCKISSLVNDYHPFFKKHKMKNIIHKSAIIDEGAIIGSGTVIWHWTHVSKKAIIGNHCKLGQNVYVANNVRIGNNCKIQNNVSIYEGVEIGNDVFCGPSMVFTNVLNPRSHISRNKDFKKTVISDGVTLGANCTIVALELKLVNMHLLVQVL